MGGVVADFGRAIRELAHTVDVSEPVNKTIVDIICEQNPRIFYDLHPVDGSVETVKRLMDLYDVYFLSTPMWNVPESFTGKRVWLEKTFGEKATKRLILTHRKDLNVGHFLVDDRFKNGADKFTGVHIHFGSKLFPSWHVVFPYLENLAITNS